MFKSSEEQAICIEEEYGYRYWVWYFHGSIEECVNHFKEMRPDNCCVSVESLNISATEGGGYTSYVREVDFKTWAKTESNGFAHWHQPDDSHIVIEDEESGERVRWREWEQEEDSE